MDIWIATTLCVLISMSLVGIVYVLYHNVFSRNVVYDTVNNPVGTVE